VWKEHEYTDRGKWMDGWESRRKRTPGHDFAIVRLGARGVVRGVVVDTSFFRGNYPSHCSIEAISMRPESEVDSLTNWIEILPQSALQGDSENLFAIDSPYAFTHLRFHIYFSKPMRGGQDIFEQIKILGPDGKEIDEAWLTDELWEDDDTHLILYIHPGRIKWGLLLRMLLGPGILNFINTPVAYAYGLAFMLSYNVRLTLAALAIYPVALLVMKRTSRLLMERSLRALFFQRLPDALGRTWRVQVLAWGLLLVGIALGGALAWRDPASPTASSMNA